MSERDSLIAELDSAYEEFVQAVEGLGARNFEQKWLDGKWGAREITAHLAGWLGQMGGGMERMSRGEKPSGTHDWSNVDEWNATFAERVRGKRRHEVVYELDHALRSFKKAASGVPDDRFGEGKTANKMFDAAGAPHLREHAQMIRDWRSKIGGAA
jgi:hypothetical protein